MAISRTLIVLGALLQGMQCNTDSSTKVPVTTAVSTTSSVSSISPSSTVPKISSASLTSPSLTTPQSTNTVPSKPSITISTLTTLGATKPASISTSIDSTKPTAPSTITPSSPTETTSSVTNKPTSQKDPVTTQITTIQPKTSNTVTTLTPFNSSTQKPSTADTTKDPKQDTTNKTTPANTSSTEVVTPQLSFNLPNSSSPVTTKNSISPATPDSISTASQNPDTKKAQTTASTIRNQDIINSTSTPQKSVKDSSDRNITEVIREVCDTWHQKAKANCTMTVKTSGSKITVTISIDVNQTIPLKDYTTPPRKEQHDSGNTDSKDTIPDTLIAILASCGALVLILCCFAAYCTYHRRSYRKNQQQHLTEELQTVENGYHDNPTLEVMEVQPEMQEKKLTMNGEFNDSWIVPIDNLLKEDIPDEEDTHL